MRSKLAFSLSKKLPYIVLIEIRRLSMVTRSGDTWNGQKRIRSGMRLRCERLTSKVSMGERGAEVRAR